MNMESAQPQIFDWKSEEAKCDMEDEEFQEAMTPINHKHSSCSQKMQTSPLRKKGSLKKEDLFRMVRDSKNEIVHGSVKMADHKFSMSPNRTMCYSKNTEICSPGRKTHAGRSGISKEISNILLEFAQQKKKSTPVF